MIPFIGIGTGRCGTKSLAEILDFCSGTQVLHEGWLTPWYTKDMAELNKMIQWLQAGKVVGSIRGSVALCYLPHIPYLRKKIPELKVVHIWRDHDAVVNSFMRMHGGISRILPETKQKAAQNANRHVNANPNFHRLAGSPAIFPKIKVPKDIQGKSLRAQASYSLYWHYYFDEVRKLEDYYELSVKDLNNNGELHKLCDYLGIKKEQRRFPKNRRYNRG